MKAGMARTTALLGWNTKLSVFTHPSNGSINEV
jgi:hypothetical protein